MALFTGSILGAFSALGTFLTTTTLGTVLLDTHFEEYVPRDRK